MGDEKKEMPKMEMEVEVEVKEGTKEIYSSINSEYLKNIKPVFQKKCFDCHSNQTKFPWYYKLPVISGMIDKDIKEAKTHLDFSNDFPFLSHDTPKKDLISILDVFEKKSMPPFIYTIIHSESKVSEEDIKKVKVWVEQSLEKLD